MITLFKGDDTGGLLGKSVVVEISTEFDLTGCTVIFNYQGIERRWENVHDGDSREVFFSHNETARMSVGTFKAVIIAVDAAGKVRTITNSLPIKVSTNLAECYGDNVAQVTIGTTVNWERITGKPFEGQEIDIGTDDKVLAALGTIIEKLGGTVKAGIALVALCAMSAFGYTPETHTNSFERDGVTYAQRGGLGAATYVVTNINMTASDIGAVDTNAVRDIAREEITPATNRLNQTLSDALDDKRDKDDLAVYEKVGVGDDWVWTSDDPDLLNALETNGIKPKRVDDDSVGYHFWYTSTDFGDWTTTGSSWDPSYGVDAHIVKFKYESPVLGKFDVTATATRAYKFSPVSPADYLAKVSQLPTEDEKAEWNGKLDKTASVEGYLGSISWKDEHTLITEQAGIEINGGNLDVHGFIKADLWSDFSVSTDIGGNLPAYLDSLAWRTTGNRTLSDYGITDGATKTELAGYLPLTGGYLKGPVYFDAGGRIYTDQGGISVNTRQGLNVYGGGSIVLESNESLTDFDNNPIISATNPAFSNAVLAVGLNIDTNSVAALNEIASTFGGFPIEGIATTVGGLLAALAAAIAWLKKNKVGSFASVGGATATVDNGVAKLSEFFTESNSLLNGRLAYSRNANGLKDRAFNTLSFDGTEFNLSTALEAVTPTASGQPRDLLIVATATAATTISFTAGTIKGDKPTIDGSGTWLITLTEYASGVWYCRQIKMEDAA